ncbi:retrovirus-related pol polyprotein from transposon TNT 1-94, partial [Tanacetum coccineum]
MNSRGKKQKANVSNTENQKKQKPKVKKPKKVGSNERLASPKPSKPRFCLRWSPTGRFFDIKGKIIASSESESQSDCSNGDNACTSNPSEPTIKRFPNSTSFLGRLSKFVYGASTRVCPKHMTGNLKLLINSSGSFWEPIAFWEMIKYFDSVGISHQASSVRTPQQNGVVERRNRTLVEAARTMLIFSCAPLFLWAEAIASACYTQNCSIIHRRFNKTPYELINGRKPDISFLHVFGALCYPKNDRENIGKHGTKGDIGFFISYSADSCAYMVYNRRTKKIMETMNVTFDELLAMAFDQSSSKPGLQSMSSGQISSGLDLTYAPSTITTQKPTESELDLLFEAMYDDYIGGHQSSAPRTAPAALAPQVLQTLTATTTTAD